MSGEGFARATPPEESLLPCMDDLLEHDRLRQIGRGCPICNTWIPEGQVKRTLNKLKRSGVPDYVELANVAERILHTRDEPAALDRVVPNTAEADLILACLDIVENRRPYLVSALDRRLISETRGRLVKARAYTLPPPMRSELGL
jgi:hypothetical protein